MSLPSQHLFTKLPARSILYFNPVGTSLKSPNLLPCPIITRHLSTTPSSFQILYHNQFNFKTHLSPLKAYESFSTAATTAQTNDADSLNLYSFLSVAELVCIVSSAIISIGFAVNYAVFGSRNVLLGEMGKKVMAWGFVGLVAGVAIGAWTRRIQWRRICRESVKGERLNLIERIEKLEEDVKSTAKIVRVLSRQLEKLGIRFRVTRKSLKEPIAETAALAQKNSEVTRALAVQEDILEKELGEIQKVLLAMQEQQQKQLELILAIGKTGKLWENRQAPSEQRDKTETYNSSPEVRQMQTQRAQSMSTSKGINSDAV